MKKVLLLLFALISIGIVLLVIFVIYISFSQVKPTTQAINQSLAKYLARIVYIPEGIPPPIYGWESTNYFWEMETPAGEFTGIRFNFTPAYSKDQSLITATLEMPENGDASIFTKVLPAVIADQQSLTSAKDPEKANLSANQNVGYREIELTTKPDTGQTIKVVWEFEKQTLDSETLKLYSQFDKYPRTTLKFLYGIPEIVIGLLGG